MPYITLPEPKYPLTESEKKWLKSRQRLAIKSCRYCDYYACESPCADYYDGECFFDYIDSAYNIKNAAEFEARVAAIMPYIVFRVVAEQAGQKDITIDAWECLKIARLVVEAEME